MRESPSKDERPRNPIDARDSSKRARRKGQLRLSRRPGAEKSSPVKCSLRMQSNIVVGSRASVKFCSTERPLHACPRERIVWSSQIHAVRPPTRALDDHVPRLQARPRPVHSCLRSITSFARSSTIAGYLALIMASSAFPLSTHPATTSYPIPFFAGHRLMHPCGRKARCRTWSGSRSP